MIASLPHPEEEIPMKKRLIQLRTPTKIASAEVEYFLVAGACEFEYEEGVGGVVMQSAFGPVWIREEEVVGFVELPADFDLAAFAESRPDVLLINQG